MALLLDTHALLWWLLDDDHLSPAAKVAIGDDEAEVLVSPVSALEVTLKHQLGKLPEAAELAVNFVGMIEQEGFGSLEISVRHAAIAGALPFHHRDPFDRLLIAQAQAEGLTLISNETLFDRYGIRRLW